MVKIKEVAVTANYAWSPSDNHMVYIAAGTAAQQLDATFSSNAKLELYAIDLSDSSVATKCCGEVETANRFQKVIWGAASPESSQTSGYIVCGTDKGGVEVYDPDKILKNEGDCVVWSSSKHTGPVRSLDFNIHQKNLFASGANDSEIYIWDLKNPDNPMTPGVKSQPTASVNSLAWNRQVQHILASTSGLSSGPCCVVWDLKKNEPVIKVHDPSGRMQCSDVAWHPEVATQLVLSSEDDHLPVVQLWDLRFATSPMKVLEKHTKGVLSLAWCSRDPDLLLSCSKDNQVYCWNPNASPPEVLYELDASTQWCFDVQWCPRNPNIVSSGSFDGHISVYSLMGGGFSVESSTPADKQRNAVAESFGSDAFSSAMMQHQQPATTTQRKVLTPLKKPPKWMRKPCGATFAFGGKLLSFDHNLASETQQQQQPAPVLRQVYLSQVVTECELLQRSNELRQAVADRQCCADYCRRKLDAAESEFEENVWSFLLVNFEAEPRKRYLELLGYNPALLQTKWNAMLASGEKGSNGDVTEQIKPVLVQEDDKLPLVNGASANDSLGTDAFEEIAAARKASITPPAPAAAKPMVIPVSDNDLDSMISQALLVGDYESAVELCLHGKRMADAIVVAIAGGNQLLEKTQKMYFETNNSKISRLLAAVVTKDWKDVVKSCDLLNWKEALASLLTYASEDELVSLCDELGQRLEGDADLKENACLCYICSGNVERLTACWVNLKKTAACAADNNVETAQNLIEKVMVLIRMLESGVSRIGEATAGKLAEYASMLANQGQLVTAMDVLPSSCDKQSVRILRDRLFHSQETPNDHAPPPFPYDRDGVVIRSSISVQRPEAQVQPQPHGTQQQLRGVNAHQQVQQNMYGMQQQQPTSVIQPFQQNPVVAGSAYTARQQPASSTVAQQPSIVAPSTASNPYAARPFQRPQPSPVPAPTPTNIYTPTVQQPTIARQPLQPAVAPGPSPMQPQQASVYHPHQTFAPAAPTLSMSMSPGERGQQSRAIPQVPGAGDVEVMRKAASGAGWNDPPTLDPNRIPRKKKATPAPYVPDNMMTPTAPAPASLPPPGAVPHMQQPGGMITMQHQTMRQQPPPQAMAQATQMVMQPNRTASPATSIQQQSQNGETRPVASVPTGALKDVPKSPIPTEHQILQRSFDELIQKCLQRATNAQHKRKLDDCTRRLEFLYDKLRANSLSPSITGGLHQVAQSVVAREYERGISQYTAIVAHSNFSEISAFMPGLKSMLQIAHMLRV